MPDNAVFYHAAYIAAAVVYGGYVVSLMVRGSACRRPRASARSRAGVARDGER